jgi:hypothetical protein
MSTPKPLPPILTQAKDTARLQVSFLEIKDLLNFGCTSKNTKSLYHEILFEKKKASELLRYIFKADPKSVKECLSEFPKPMGYSIILTKSCCKELFISQEKHIKRIWTNISPLEAAAWCGDNFLVKELLAHIPASQHKIAVAQLQGILDRKGTEENGAYLAPFITLLKAYKDYFAKWESEISEIGKGNNGVLDSPWQNVWERQRRLSTFGLQTFWLGFQCSKREPDRSALIFQEDSEMDFCSMPSGYALVKSGMTAWNVRGIDIATRPTPAWPRVDSILLKRFTKNLRTGLINIIHELNPPSLEEEIDSEVSEKSVTISPTFS